MAQNKRGNIIGKVSYYLIAKRATYCRRKPLPLLLKQNLWVNLKYILIDDGDIIERSQGLFQDGS
jgi:hypothetical protein